QIPISKCLPYTAIHPQKQRCQNGFISSIPQGEFPLC
ncbi:hypothetical protein C369_00908, partial [Cryptococcus neoformans A5-35-17]